MGGGAERVSYDAGTESINSMADGCRALARAIIIRAWKDSLGDVGSTCRATNTASYVSALVNDARDFLYGNSPVRELLYDILREGALSEAENHGKQVQCKEDRH